MTKISILHLGNAVADSSSGRIIQRLVSHLGQETYRWHVGGICGLGDMQEEFVRLGVQVVDFSDCQNGSRYLPKRIRDYVSAHDVRIVHTHSPRSCLVAAWALLGLRQTIHLLTNHSFYSHRDRNWGLLYAMVNRIALYSPDHVVAVSDTMRRQILGLPGLDAQRVTVILNAIECAMYFTPEKRNRSRSELGLFPQSHVLGFTGRIETVKRLDLLLRAFSEVLVQYPLTRLIIVGEGGQRAALETLAASLGISQAVIWTGFRKDIPRLLAAMDIYVQSSTNEGLPLSILEAMAAGKVVIASDVGGTREVLTHQKTGILIPSGSSQAIVAAVVDLLDHPKKRAALAQAAREHVLREFGVDRMVEGYRRIYESLASRLLSSTG